MLINLNDKTWTALFSSKGYFLSIDFQNISETLQHISLYNTFLNQNSKVKLYILLYIWLAYFNKNNIIESSLVLANGPVGPGRAVRHGRNNFMGRSIQIKKYFCI